MEQEPLFIFKNVNKSPLKQLDFKVKKGENVMLFGPSGAGKSTLLHLFNRLSDPEEGSIQYLGKNLQDYGIIELRKQVGLVMQAPNLFPGTVLDNLKFGPSLHGEWKDSNAKSLLEAVQLPLDYLNRAIDQLSGGEQQRVSLARTLANKPSVLLLDEPTSALDQHTTEEIEQVLEGLAVEQGVTLIMVTHHLDQAKRLGSRGIFLADGEIVEEGNIEDLLSNPKTEELTSFMS
ncbi:MULTISPECIES: ABC transporter ATP-binding protein [Pontibacillus]|uniref:Phosphate ABC transporter ATP-binding protein n=1 Tax=Pontibacillus chungwhensis TaxID=265426 RepID=A0ABY8UTD7_9BACI|nr:MULTISPECIES: phosphate ABC transporter ATP-binding protein [Pontibacillus]MCD5323563.1 phosphate ABC transporter ATP-binding protein [Pontibacillus sp. HN14]WIF96932.1 phosphate ABC transporter ATP-binding protein [Pontibacillus chungwhensis]